MHAKHILFLVCLISPFLLTGQELQTESMAPMPEQARDDAVGFAVEGTGYILGGRKADFALTQELWAYNPASDTWEQKAEFPGIARQYLSAFILNGQAHIIGGLGDPGIYLSDHWVYDHHSDTWDQLSDLPCEGRFAACSFVLEDQVYYGTGRGADTTYSDLWVYASDLDMWTLLLDLPHPLYGAEVCQIDAQVYISGGILDEQSISASVLSFDGSQILERKDLDLGRANADILHLGPKSMMVGGRTEQEDATSTMLELEAFSSGSSIQYEWHQRTETMPVARRNGAAFSIDGSGYYFGGKDSNGVKSNELIRVDLKDNSPSTVQVYPNPAEAYFTISSELMFREVNIYDAAGHVLFESSYSSPLESLRVTTTDLKPGLHFVETDNSEVVPILIVE